MSRTPFNPSEVGDTNNENAGNRSMVDVLALPDLEQELITWIMRQREVSLAEAVAHMNQAEEAVRKMLDALSNQGFVEILNQEGELRYRTDLAPKQKSRAPKKLWQDLDL
jgi:predicted ArsR family transcriptional regulator